MVKKRVILLLLCLIFVIGLGLRTFKLGRVPVSLTIDEIAESYNSLSILKTGRDEYGQWFPLAFRSIGDYKSPLLFYTMIPAIGIFGLTEFGTRITVALIGSLTVFVVFWLVKLLLRNETIALFSAFSVAVSPWHIKPTRMTHDAVLGLFFVLLGVCCFLKSVEGRMKYLWISAIFFAMSMYAYHSEKMFTPLIVLTLVMLYFKDLLLYKKRAVIALVAGLLLIFPLFIVLLTPQGRIRAESTFITRDFEINRFLHKKEESLSLISSILDNNFIMMVNFWAKRYLDYFDPVFLFTAGMGFSLPGFPDLGLLYLYEFPFLLVGLYLIISDKKLMEVRVKKLLIVWLIIGPLPASFANNAQHTIRSLTLIPLYQLFFAIGFYFIAIKARIAWFIKISTISTVFLVSMFSIAYFIDLYFVQYQYFYSEYFMDGWKDAAKYALSNQDKYDQIIIDPRFGTMGPFTVGTPYLYVLFYGEINPGDFQNDPRRKEFETSSNFSNFTFREIDWATGANSDQEQKKSLFIGSKWVLPAREEEIKQRFYLYNGKEILRAVTPI